MNILILYLLAHDLKTIYDIDGKYDHVKDGDFVLDSSSVRGWVVDLPGCVQEGNRMLREERQWLLEQGKTYAQSRTQADVKGDVVLLFDYSPA